MERNNNNLYDDEDNEDDDSTDDDTPKGLMMDNEERQPKADDSDSSEDFGDADDKKNWSWEDSSRLAPRDINLISLKAREPGAAPTRRE